MKNLFIFCISVYWIWGCTNTNSNYLKNTETKEDSIWIMWRKDSLSCHGFRTYEKAKLMTKYLDSLSGKKEIDIVNLLGYPIDKYKINGSTIYKYTLDHPCNIKMINGKYEYDFCWLEINQNKDRYFSSIVCE